MQPMPCLLVDSPAQWRVLVSPMRAGIVEALRLLGPGSMAGLAVHKTRPPAASQTRTISPTPRTKP